MPLIRKLQKLGTSSKAVILPKGWLDYIEEETGSPVDSVAIEVNGDLKISPVVREAT